jgi:hypothetical protein
MDIESDLKRAMRRESPPSGFASRVVARLDAKPAQRRRAPWWRAVAAGIVLTALGGGWAVHEQVRRLERREGERARDEVLLALRIAGAQVRTAQEHVHEIGSH